jgi:hypothetical protein
MYTDDQKRIWFRENVDGVDKWTKLAGELRKVTCIMSWLKFTDQWDSVRDFIRAETPHLNHLHEAALLSHYLGNYPEPIPLNPNCELYIHQSSSRSIVAKMVRPRFLYGLKNLRTDTRRVACPGPKTDWYMELCLTPFNCCVLGDSWTTTGLPKYRYETGGHLGGQGTCSKVLVASP